MRRLVFLCLALFLSLGIAQAGPNSNGAIVVHTNDAYNYSAGTACTTTLGMPANCASALTQSDKNFVTAGQRSTVWFLAAFLPTASPRVASVYFGTDVDDVNFDAGSNYGPCAPAGSTSQVPDAGWPYDMGNSVGFGTPVLGNTLFRFYVFGLDNYDDNPTAPNPWWCSTINPTGGYAAFFDDAFPPSQDDITQFGCVKWYETGSNSCPQAQASGSCCGPDGSCTVTAQIDCAAPGVWHGEWTSCEPNNCPQPVGACCATDGACAITEETACVAPSVWHADWASCEPNPCPQPPLPPPTLESPADAAICIPVTGIVDWSDVVDATGYKVQIGVNCGAGVEHIVTASEFAFDLEPNTKYYWHVATRNVSGIFGAYSTCRTFTTEPILLAAPILETPSDAATCQATSGTLNWSDVADAAGYRIQINTSPSSGPEYDVASSDYAYSGLLPGTLYYWRVRTKNACGAYGAYSNSFSFTTDGPLAAPALLSPADGSTDQPVSVTLAWAAVAGATAYTVQFGTPCGTGVETELAATESSVAGLSPGATYYWRVKTRNSCGTYGAYSTCFSFTTAAIPPATGACCNTTTGACTITTEAACGFTWLGADVPCNTTTCPVPAATGACCNTTTGACTITTQAACGFTWLGADVPCNTTTCPAPPPATGACCNTTTGACTITTEAACGFTWLGADVPCNTTTCPVPAATGACCNTTTGACTITTQAACGFTWLGADVPCNTTTCPVPPPATGACCNTTTGACTITTEAACGFTWLGADVPCNTTTCPVPAATGACCNTTTGACTITTAAACGFTWLGAEVPCNTTTCPVPPPSDCLVKIVFPKGGQNLKVGTEYSVVWTSTGCGPTVAIELFLDGIVCQTIASNAPNTGSYPWVATQCNGNNMGYKVRVTDLLTGSYAESLIPFTISVAPTTMVVTSPNGGEYWDADTHHDITWTSTNGAPTVKIELIHGGAICVLLDPAAPNTGSYDWLVAGCRGTGGYEIRVSDVSFGIWDQSDATFDIGDDRCQLAVTSPGSREVWPRGSSHAITWDSRGGCGDYVKIDLLKQVGANYEFCMPIIASTINDGSFDWTADRCGGATARYRILITNLTRGESHVSGGYLRISDTGQTPVALALVTVPNPFRVNSLVTFDLEYDAGVQAAIYNVAGQMVRSLVDQVLPGGRHDIAWDARDYTGVEVPSGIYYLKAVVDGEPVTKKILLIH